jgi:hypothetical protein
MQKGGVLMRRHELSDEQFALPLSGKFYAAPKKRR